MFDVATIEFYFDIEKNIGKHYKNLRRLFVVEKQIELLKKQRQGLIEDMHDFPWSLTNDLRGICYDSDKVQNSSSSSPPERQIEQMFFHREKHLERLNDNIIFLEDERTLLKIETAVFSIYIHMLSDEEQKLLYMRYDKRKSFNYISIELGYSETAIRKKRDKIMLEIEELTGGKRNVCVDGAR